MTEKIYTMPEGKTIRGMANTIREYLWNSENMSAMVMTTENGLYIIQGRVRNWKAAQWFGMDKTIQVFIIPHENSVITVEIGKGEWIKKSMTMAASMVVLWPLAVTSTVGMIRQGKLPERIDHVIQLYLAGLAGTVSGSCIPENTGYVL